MIEVLLNNEVGFDLPRSLFPVIRAVLGDHHVQHGEISLAVVDDVTIHELNRKHLQHDYPTDVLSFILDRHDNELDGEIIVSSETATRMAPEFEWSAQAELLLYLIHGCLHLVGYDDHSEEDRHVMRAAEAKYLRLAGVLSPSDHSQRILKRSEEKSA